MKFRILLVLTFHTLFSFAQQAEHLPRTVNSPFEEREPTLSADGNTLYFWRRQMPDNTGGLGDPGDIWFSGLDREGDFSQAQRALPPLNSLSQEFIWQISADGDTFWISQFDPRYPDPGFKYVVRLGPNRWSKPRSCYLRGMALQGRYKAFFLSPQRVLLVTNEGTEGRGGVDIFACFPLNDSTWGNPVNLGPEINTPGDEDAPFMLADGKTLFFNSDGHTREPQHDVYFSTRLDNSWTRWSPAAPVGAPINTPGYDFDLVFSPDEKYVYWGSESGSYGSMDLFRMDISECKVDLYPEGDLVLCMGETIILEAGFAFAPGLRFQWQKDGVDIPGATEATFTVSNTGEYRLVRSWQGCRAASEPKQVTFIPRPQVQLLARETFICQQDSIVLKASSEEASSWQWYKNGLQIPGHNRPEYWVKYPGNYYVEVGNGACTTRSETIRVGKLRRPEVYPADLSQARASAHPYKWLWTKEFSDKREDLLLKDLSSDPQGMVAVLGMRERGRQYEENLKVFDPEGNFLWEKEGVRTENPSNRFVHMDYEGNVLVASREQYLRKFSPSGKLLWEKPQAMQDIAGLTTDPLGHVYVLGRFTDTLLLEDRRIPPRPRGAGFLAKYDPWGNFLWVKVFSAETYSHDFGNALGCDQSGNVYVAGGFELIAGFERDKVLRGALRARNYFLAKYFPNGSIHWVRKYSTNDPGFLTCDLHTDPDGNSYLLLNYKLVKYDSQGRVDWQANLQLPGNEQPAVARIAVDGQGTLFTMGVVRDKNDYFLTRTDRRGQSMMVWAQNNSNRNPAHLPAIFGNEEGKLILAGTANGRAPSREDIGSLPAFISVFGAKEEEMNLPSLRLCPGETVTLVAHLPLGQPFYWLKDGKPISQVTDTLLTVSEKGTYQVRTFSNDCQSESNLQVVEDCYQALAGKPEKAPSSQPEDKVQPDLPPVPPAKPTPPPVVVAETSKVPNKLDKAPSGKPNRLNNRKVKNQGTITIRSPKVILSVWDHAAMDNDTISLSVNGRWLLEEYALQKEKKQMEVTFSKTGPNFIILFAHNLGTVPPNTMSVSIDDGVSEQTLKLKSNLNNCGSVRIEYAP